MVDSDNDFRATSSSAKESHNEEKEVSELLTNIDDFLRTFQSNHLKAKQDKNDSKESNSMDTTCPATNNCPVAKKLPSHSSGDHGNRLLAHLPNRSLRGDIYEKIRPERRLPVHNCYNDLVIPGSIQKIPSSDELNELNKLRSKKTDRTTRSVANMQSKKIPFPQVLHVMLENAKVKGYDDIVSWQKHGKSFLVKDKKRFVADIMPQYFNQTRYASFQRQLALYGFVRLTQKKNDDFGSYYHERFLRGYPDLSCTIQRTAIKGTALQNLSSSTVMEPDFQTMKPVGIDDYFPEFDDRQQPISDDGQNSYCHQPSHRPDEKMKSIKSTSDAATNERIKSDVLPQRHLDLLTKIKSSGKELRNEVNDFVYDSLLTDDDEDFDNDSMAEFLSDVDL